MWIRENIFLTDITIYYYTTKDSQLYMLSVLLLLFQL